MYVAVKGGETAIAHSLELLADKRRGDRDVAELSLEQIDQQLGLAVDRVMTEGSCYDRELAALAIKQARGDLVEAIFLLRAYRTTLPRFGDSLPIDTAAMVGRAAHLGDLQGRAGRPGAGPDLRLHPSPARLRAGRRRASGRTRRPRRSTRAAGPAAGRRHPGARGLLEPPPPARRAPARPDARAARPAGRRGRCACRTWRAATRASCWRWAIRPSAATATTIPSSARSASAACRSSFVPEELGFAIEIAEIDVTECDMVNQFAGSHDVPPQFTRGYGLAFGHAERKAMAMALVDRALRAEELSESGHRAGAGRGIRAVPLRQRRGVGLRAAPEAAALRRLPVRAGGGAGAARRGRGAQPAAPRSTRRRSRPCRTQHRRRRLQLRLSRRADQADDPPRHPEGGGDAGLPGAVRRPRDAAALWLGHRRHPGDGRHHRPRRHAEGHRPGRRRHDQRRLDPPLLRQAWPTSPPRRSTEEATIIQTRHRMPETPLREGQILVFQVPIPEPLRMLEPRETETRTLHALSRVRRHAGQPLREHRPPRPHRQDLRLSGDGERALHDEPLADPEVRQSQARPQPGAAALRRRAARSASTPCRPTRRSRASTSTTIRSRSRRWTECCALCGSRESFLDEMIVDDAGKRHVRLLRHRLLRATAAGEAAE